MALYHLCLSNKSPAWRTYWLSADELPFPEVACHIVPVHVGHILAMKECTVLTVTIFVNWVVRLLVASSHSPSGEVPGVAVGPSPASLLSLICSSNPDRIGSLLLQLYCLVIFSKYLPYIEVQEIVNIFWCNRGQVSIKLPALHLSCSPEEFLLAPEVATAIEFLPTRITNLWTFIGVAVVLWKCWELLWN